MSTIRWKGLTGDWTVPSDWVDGSAPLSGDDVLFNTGGSYTATISTDVLAASVTFSDTGGKLVENAGASLTLSGTFTLTTGTVELDGSTSVGSFAQSGGTLSGSGTLTVTGAAQIAVGPNDNITQSGSGTTVLEDGGTLSGIATNALFLRDSRVLENEGTFAWQSTPIKILDSASIDNAAGATFDDQFDGSITAFNVGGTFINAGTFVKSAGTGITTIAAAFDNTGTVEVDSGTLDIIDPLSGSGQLVINGPGAVLELHGGGDSGSNFHNAITGNVTFAAGLGTLRLDSPLSFIGSISAFAAGDLVDLVSVGFDSAGTATLGSGNVLSVVESGATYGFNLDPAQDFTGATFVLSADGISGTDVGIIDAVVSSGSIKTVTSGRAVYGVTVLTGGTMDILAGGTAGFVTVSSGGFVQDLGTTHAITVNAGGGFVILAGATDSGTTISNGGTETVSSGGLALSTTALGGVLNVLAGGTASGTTDSGGADVVSGTAISTLVGNGGIEAVFGPGTSLSATVLAGGVQYVLSGGHASGTTDSGGADIVLAGGTASGTMVASGGTEVASSGGTLLSATVLAGGVQYVLSSGAASGTTDSGGADIVLAGGVESGTRVASGGTEVASSGGVLRSATILAGGVQYILSGGTGIGTTDSGGADIMLAGGIESGTTVSNGGIEVMSSGGVSLATTVLAGGLQYVLSGGTASGTSVINAGNEQILSGGTAVGTTVSGGGFLVVSSGGTINGATIAGATMEIQSGGLTGANAITYSGGAALVLDASANFSGTIANFKTGDFLDLKDIAFGSSTSMSFVEAGNNLSGTLTVTDGSHTAHITLLGSYTPGQFNSASDSHSGTVITDPPASPPVLWASTPDANTLLWQPTSSNSSAESGVGLRGGGAGPWLGGDPTHLLWQPANSTGGLIEGGFLQTTSAETLGWTMHQPSLGG